MLFRPNTCCRFQMKFTDALLSNLRIPGPYLTSFACRYLFFRPLSPLFFKSPVSFSVPITLFSLPVFLFSVPLFSFRPYSFFVRPRSPFLFLPSPFSFSLFLYPRSRRYPFSFSPFFRPCSWGVCAADCGSPAGEGLPTQPHRKEGKSIRLPLNPIPEPLTWRGRAERGAWVWRLWFGQAWCLLIVALKPATALVPFSNQYKMIKEKYFIVQPPKERLGAAFCARSRVCMRSCSAERFQKLFCF